MATSKTPRKRQTPSVTSSANEAAEALTTSARTMGRIAGASRAASRALSTNLTSELNNIDFKKMIGGPLQACVDAQVASSLATINFINEVGFTTDTSGKKELVMVDFSHSRKDVKADGTADDKTINIKVPLIAMLPIPSLRIDHVTIDFNVKLNSVETSQVSSDFKVAAEVKGGWGPVNFKVSASYQRKSTTGVEVRKEYALNVNVKAVQDEIPAGLEKILNMLSA
ncbi:MAG TPA: DUF2589 domain-containing protein [Niabella sp.]|nr:DUF2589 domain-containing protein [Niabella sp.]HOZ96212.1 DUF2589 domain-containing protein [Niabella sp.]HQW13577.1 DUF2589 domain-containing protein [Niabella sp.]HQX18971.1 DUF2589 domain-containing protein [Niabella sp.]HQX40476.1 DUF2589 domain-containing protein [Niabella sp.]